MPLGSITVMPVPNIGNEKFAEEVKSKFMEIEEWTVIVRDDMFGFELTHIRSKNSIIILNIMKDGTGFIAPVSATVEIRVKMKGQSWRSVWKKGPKVSYAYHL